MSKSHPADRWVKLINGNVELSRAEKGAFNYFRSTIQQCAQKLNERMKELDDYDTGTQIRVMQQLQAVKDLACIGVLINKFDNNDSESS